MGSGLNEQALARFWQGVMGASDRFVSDAMDGAMRGEETSEFVALAAALSKVHPDLLLIVGGPNIERPEIVISAGGLTEVIPHVLAIVDAAPPRVRDRFGVRAFRPRVLDARQRIRTKGAEVGAEDIHWSAVQHRRPRNRCDLTLYVPGYIDALPSGSVANERVCSGAFLLLDHLLGEWAVMTQIGAIDWHGAAGGQGHPDLSALPDFLDKITAED